MMARSFCALSLPLRRSFTLCSHNVAPWSRQSLYFGAAVPRCMSTSVLEQFEQVKKRLATLKEDPGTDTKLKMYALYKQGTEGKVTSKRPGMMDFVARAKWDAWNSVADMSGEEAFKAYNAIVDELVAAEGGAGAASQESPILVTVKDGLRIITLNRPKKKNAITAQMYNDWTALLAEAASDDETVITAVTGAGDFFCSGNDLSNFTNIPPGGVADLAEISRKRLLAFVDSFIDFPKPLVGVINGPAVGIAVTTLGLYDSIYVSDKAWFQTPFTQLGQTAEGCSSYTFPRIMGPGLAAEMLYFNKKMSAREAQQCGLVTEVLPHDKLQQEVWPRLQALAKLPPKGLYYSKELSRSWEKDALKKANIAECDRLVERWQSEDCKNAIMAFFSRQK
ncbi:Crotonase superfamily [Trinorchestia longiramus]|nr:Crotonase superfamily [Trinorchestia longiramus]